MTTYTIRRAVLPVLTRVTDHELSMRAGIDRPLSEAMRGQGLPQQSSGWARAGASAKNSDINREKPVRWGWSPRKPYGVKESET